MAQGELSREVIEGLARAAGIDPATMPPDKLLQGEMADVWRGIARFDDLDIQKELPAFVSALSEGRHGD